MSIVILFMSLLAFVSAQMTTDWMTTMDPGQNISSCICTAYTNNSYTNCGTVNAAGNCMASDSSCEDSDSYYCVGNNTGSYNSAYYWYGYDDSCVCNAPATAVQNMTECICTGYTNNSYTDCGTQNSDGNCMASDSSCDSSGSYYCFGNNTYTGIYDDYYGNGYDDECVCHNWSDVLEALATAIIVAIVIGSLVCCGIVVAILCCVCGGIACCCAAGAGAGAAAGTQQQQQPQQNQMTTV